MSPLACSHSGMASRNGASIRRQCRMERRGASSLGGTGRPHNTASLPDITIAMRYSIPAKGMKHQPFAAVPFLSSYFSRFLPGWLTAGPVPVFGGAENLLWFFSVFTFPSLPQNFPPVYGKAPGLLPGKLPEKGGIWEKGKKEPGGLGGLHRKSRSSGANVGGAGSSFFALSLFAGCDEVHA